MGLLYKDTAGQVHEFTNADASLALPIASEEKLGAIKVGEGLEIDANGNLKVPAAEFFTIIEEDVAFADGQRPNYPDGWYIFNGNVTINGADATSASNGWFTRGRMMYIYNYSDSVYFHFIIPHRARQYDQFSVYRYYKFESEKWFPEEATSAYTKTALTTSTGLSKTNTTSYTPTKNYHPATKKYVDDNAGIKVITDIAFVDGTDPATQISTGITYMFKKISFNGKDNGWFKNRIVEVRKTNERFTLYTITPSEIWQYLTMEFYYDYSTNTWKPENGASCYVNYTVHSGNIQNYALTKNNTTAYVPTEDYHPATKQYVDNAFAPQMLHYATDDATTVAILNQCIPVDPVNKVFNILHTPMLNTNYGMTYFSSVALNADGSFVYYTFKGMQDASYGGIDYYDLNTIEAIIIVRTSDWTVYSRNIKVTPLLSRDNNIVYTPKNSYNPATKKYVDDCLAGVGIGGPITILVASTNNIINFNNLTEVGMYLIKDAGQTTVLNAPSALAFTDETTVYDIVVTITAERGTNQKIWQTVKLSTGNNNYIEQGRECVIGEGTVWSNWENIGSLAKYTYRLTVPTTGWSDTSPYTIDLEAIGMTEEDEDFIVSPKYSTDKTTRQSQAEAWGKISMVTSGVDKVTIICDDALPTVEVPFSITVVK